MDVEELFMLGQRKWLGYISVEDVDQASKIVEENKGILHVRPKNLPDRGRVAIPADPSGAIFAIQELTIGKGDEQ